VAVERGPLVYALESVDNPGLDLDLVTLDIAAPLQDADNVTGIEGIVPVAAGGTVRDVPAAGWPYGGSAPRAESRSVALTLVPYYRWANRGASTMRVWAPRTDLSMAEVDA
jgi:DUF1680 family protein